MKFQQKSNVKDTSHTHTHKHTKIMHGVDGFVCIQSATEIELNWKQEGLILKVNRRQRWKEFNKHFFFSSSFVVAAAAAVRYLLCSISILGCMRVFFLRFLSAVDFVVVVSFFFSFGWFSWSYWSHFRAYIELLGLLAYVYESCDINLLVSPNQDRIG